MAGVVWRPRHVAVWLLTGRLYASRAPAPPLRAAALASAPICDLIDTVQLAEACHLGGLQATCVALLARQLAAAGPFWHEQVRPRALGGVCVRGVSAGCAAGLEELQAQHTVSPHPAHLRRSRRSSWPSATARAWRRWPARWRRWCRRARLSRPLCTACSAARAAPRAASPGCARGRREGGAGRGEGWEGRGCAGAGIGLLLCMLPHLTGPP